MTIEQITAEIAILDTQERAIREKIKAWGGDATRQEINQIRMIDQKRWPLKAARDSANRTA